MYPLNVLVKAGIKEIMIITAPEQAGKFMQFLGSGERFGCEFSFRIQERPGGIAQVLGMAEAFAAGDSICAVLGDNIFLDDLSEDIKAFNGGGHLFVTEVPDPERFGVVEMNNGKVVSVEEKPKNPKSNLAGTGCYVYDNRCFEVVRNLKPSYRGELEITDVNKWYLDQGELQASVLQKYWIDAGTFDSLLDASNAIYAEKKQSLQENSSSIDTVSKKQENASVTA
jgi:glucose-1-phosphate thymidylyltransferase